MSKELYVDFVHELPSMLKRVSECPDHLQETVLHGMISAFIAPPHGTVYPERTLDFQAQPAGDMTVAPNVNSGDWDYRRELIAFIGRDGIEMNGMSGIERTAVVAYVFKILAPEEHRLTAVTANILEEACRQARVRLPANPSATLSKAKKAGLLDSAKGSRGYVLSPHGENFVNDMIAKAAQDG